MSGPKLSDWRPAAAGLILGPPTMAFVVISFVASLKFFGRLLGLE